MHTDRDIPTVMQTLRDAGYLTGILGKVGHSTPKADYKWDFAHDQKELGNGRDPDMYYNNEGLTMRAMVEAAKTRPDVAQRVKMFRYRAAEELYDLKNDPDCLDNLAGKPGFENELKERQDQIHDWMKRTGDPLLQAFENRNSPEKLKSALTEIYGENYTRPAARQPKARRTNKKKAKNKRKNK